MSSKRLDQISDFARHGYRLSVDCLACKHLAVIDPRRIVDLCSKRGWSRDVRLLQQRFRCSECGSREVRLGPVFKD